jgi:hypothetical protein
MKASKLTLTPTTGLRLDPHGITRITPGDPYGQGGRFAGLPGWVVWVYQGAAVATVHATANRPQALYHRVAAMPPAIEEKTPRQVEDDRRVGLWND